MQGLLTALKQTSRHRLVAATGAVAALASVSSAVGMQINQADVLQTRSRDLTADTKIILRECSSEHPELMAEREKLLDELKTREDSISRSVSARLSHVLEPWPLKHQAHGAWYLQHQALSLFMKTCDPEYYTESETVVADNIPEHFWQGKLQTARFLLYILAGTQ